MSRKRHSEGKVSEEYWEKWFKRISELYSETGDIQNYAGYIHKKLKKEKFCPSHRKLATRLRKWHSKGRLVLPMASTPQPVPANGVSSGKTTDEAQENHPNRSCATSQPDPVDHDLLFESMDWAGFDLMQPGDDDCLVEGMDLSNFAFTQLTSGERLADGMQ